MSIWLIFSFRPAGAASNICHFQGRSRANESYRCWCARHANCRAMNQACSCAGNSRFTAIKRGSGCQSRKPAKFAGMFFRYSTGKPAFCAMSVIVYLFFMPYFLRRATNFSLTTAKTENLVLLFMFLRVIFFSETFCFLENLVNLFIREFFTRVHKTAGCFIFENPYSQRVMALCCIEQRAAWSDIQNLFQFENYLVIWGISFAIKQTRHVGR